MIDWAGSDNVVLYNPRLPKESLDLLLKGAQETYGLKGHVWMATSGTSGVLKWSVLSKEAFLACASAVNRHFAVSSADVWINCLPLFHAGGLAIHARAHLSGSTLIDLSGGSRWDPHHFIVAAEEAKATLTSLVPAQVYDLVTNKLKAPERLRAAVVGGGALSGGLYREALRLGWPLLPSYGLTECASQVATAELDSWRSGTGFLLKPLDHVELSLTGEGKLKIRSRALLTGYVYCTNKEIRWEDPKVDGWLLTEDCAAFDGRYLGSVSRAAGFVKIAGESVDMGCLERVADETAFSLRFSHAYALVAMPDPRLGHAVHLAVEGSDEAECSAFVEAFGKRVAPYERIVKVWKGIAIPRSPLGKVLKQSLREILERFCSCEDRCDAAVER